MPEPTHLTLSIRQHGEALWRWSMVETQYGKEIGSGYARADRAARSAAHRYAALLWPNVLVVERES